MTDPEPHLRVGKIDQDGNVKYVYYDDGIITGDRHWSKEDIKQHYAYGGVVNPHSATNSTPQRPRNDFQQIAWLREQIFTAHAAGESYAAARYEQDYQELLNRMRQARQAPNANPPIPPDIEKPSSGGESTKLLDILSKYKLITDAGSVEMFLVHTPGLLTDDRECRWATGMRDDFNVKELMELILAHEQQDHGRKLKKKG
jgi:hypothetical protein